MNPKPKRKSDCSSRLLWLLLVIWPLIILFLMPGHALLAGSHWFWMVLILCTWILWMLLGDSGEEGNQATEPPIANAPRMLHEAEQPEAVRDVMNVRIATEEAGLAVFRGRLRESASGAFAKLKNALSNRAIPMLQEDQELGCAIILLPKEAAASVVERPVRVWLHWLLFALTLLTTTWAGAAHQGIDLLRQPERFAVGIPYSLGLLAILGIHELGHYFAARRHGINVTPPFFIPLPFALGTFGAFIQMRSPTENRRALFDVAVAGPLAGLLVAIPALLIGLRSSVIVPGDALTADQMFGGTSVGSSVLFALLAKFSLGDALQVGHILRLSPLAFAGWLGLFITALNLLPIGQLDGGHAARAMFGQRIGTKISSIAIWTLFLLAIFVWPGLMMWALIVFFIAGHGSPPLNDVTPITPGRRCLGYATFAILALILLPIPHSFWNAAGIHCPYL